jgi:hypothetical protein
MLYYKTIAQTLFVLSVLKFVFAAPVVPQEAHDARNNVVAEDVTGVSERRRGVPPGVPPDGATPGPHLSSTLPDGPPTPNLSEKDDVPLRDPTIESSTAVHPLSEEEDVPLRDPTTESSTAAHPLSAANEITPASDLNSGASTPSASESPTNRPVSGPATAEGSTTTHYTPVTHGMLSKDPKPYQTPLVKKIAGFGIIFTVAAGIALYSVLHNKHNKDE